MYLHKNIKYQYKVGIIKNLTFSECQIPKWIPKKSQNERYVNHQVYRGGEGFNHQSHHPGDSNPNPNPNHPVPITEWFLPIPETLI